MNVGVLGGGQLARLLALSGEPLGIRVVCLDPAPDACAAAVAPHICAAFDDHDALGRLAVQCDVVTYEFENVPSESIAFLAGRVRVHPDATALRIGADRVAEKALFRRLGMETADFAAIESRSELDAAAAVTGLPAVLKTRHAGYDGKGQRWVLEAADLVPAWQRLGRRPSVLESRVDFDRELSIVAARASDGEMVFYPLSENRHRDGILRLALSRPGDPWQEPAQQMARSLMDSLDYVGVLALEIFQVGDALLANEFAPRVHNSGHWTLQGAATSQFENHLRAILGLPLGPTAATGVAATVNFIGRMPDPAAVLAVPNCYLHAYGKSPRSGRKVGHATVLTPDTASCEILASRLLEIASATVEG